MRHHDVIYLLIPETIEDELGQRVKTGSFRERMVYANELGIGAIEFYAAAESGLKPEKQFEFWAVEYQGERLMRHEGKTYSVIRTQKKGEKIRITCQEDAANG